MLDLGYPAGPVIEEFAARGNPSTFEFPLPMTTSGDYNLSFSGLKTFARRLIEQLKLENTLSKQVIYDLCASVQYAVFRHICHKLSKVLQDNQDLGQV
jgi:N6-L-threonylcarbamoyladenine synthase